MNFTKEQLELIYNWLMTERAANFILLKLDPHIEGEFECLTKEQMIKELNKQLN